jgi:hypothetical protein
MPYLFLQFLILRLQFGDFPFHRIKTPGNYCITVMSFTAVIALADAESGAYIAGQFVVIAEV